ncbi:hypothetical protein MASR2M48_33760 [Spirochaetota bacterium]
MPTVSSPISKKSRANGSLTDSFIRILLVYLAIQFGIFCAYSIPIGFFASYALPYATVTVAFHGLLFIMLRLFKDDFVIEPSGIKLTKVNKANAITLFRVSTLPTILFVIIASKDYALRYELIALVAVIFATDFLDGYVSRKDKETTRVGKMMDSASDYALLFVISLVFYYFHIIPTWFLVLLLIRLVGQGLMVLFLIIVNKRITPRTSFMGKATVASTMVLYAFELLRFVADISPKVYTGLEYIVGAILVASILDKVLIMKRDLGSPMKVSSGSGRLKSNIDGEHNGDDKERA